MTQILSTPDARPRSAPRTSPLEYRIANTREDRLAAYELVYDHYVKAGFMPPNQFGYRVTSYHLLPSTQVFLALREGRPICTVSLISDGPAGLPMQAIYEEEVNRSRRQGLFVGEVSALAGHTGDFRSFLTIFVQLTRLMAQYARQQDMHQFLIAVHPKHAGFYERFMGFEKIGPVREYPYVQNAPAVACCLDFERIDRDRPKCWYDFFGTAVPDSELKTYPMEEDESQEFQMAADFYESGFRGSSSVKSPPLELCRPLPCTR